MLISRNLRLAPSGPSVDLVLVLAEAGASVIREVKELKLTLPTPIPVNTYADAGSVTFEVPDDEVDASFFLCYVTCGLNCDGGNQAFLTQFAVGSPTTAYPSTLEVFDRLLGENLATPSSPGNCAATKIWKDGRLVAGTNQIGVLVKATNQQILQLLTSYLLVARMVGGAPLTI